MEKPISAAHNRKNLHSVHSDNKIPTQGQVAQLYNDGNMPH